MEAYICILRPHTFHIYWKRPRSLWVTDTRMGLNMQGFCSGQLPVWEKVGRETAELLDYHKWRREEERTGGNVIDHCEVEGLARLLRESESQTWHQRSPLFSRNSLPVTSVDLAQMWWWLSECTSRPLSVTFPVVSSLQGTVSRHP
jgi:hypothetical protein